jgi:hypothetical protein
MVNSFLYTCNNDLENNIIMIWNNVEDHEVLEEMCGGASSKGTLTKLEA